MTDLISTTNPSHGIRNNPVAVKELRSRMRGGRAFVILTAYLVLMAAIVTLIYFATVQNSFNPASGRQAGQAIFGAVIFVQIFLAGFIGPAFTSGAISGERERQTWDLLRTTLIPARRIISGKLVAALAYVFLLLAASLPLHGIVLLLGGVDWVEMVISQLLIAISTLLFALWGLYASTRMRSTLTATIVAYSGVLLMLIGIPFVLFMAMSISGLGFWMYGVNEIAPWQIVLIHLGYLLFSLNLPFALIASDALYRGNNTIWYHAETITTGGTTATAHLISPWVTLTVGYLLLSLLLFWLAKRNLDRLPDQ
jgi:ABC-type transport system involved in multi-copper enzyme maturation permease subunit